MCLFIEVFALEAADPSSSAIRAEPSTRLFISAMGDQIAVSRDGGCACDLLSDEAGWDDRELHLRQDVREPFARQIAKVAERFPFGFILQAGWAGDSITKEASITVNDITRLARSNRLASCTRYTVVPETV